MVIVDELAMFNQDPEDLVDKYIRPSLIDRQGTLILESSPSDFAKGYFYELTKDLPEEPSMTVRVNKTAKWHVYRWTPRENPFIKDSWEREHQEMLTNNPLIVETPAYKQMWLGHWCIDDDALVYKYSEARNVAGSLPHRDYQYVLGIDLGWSDPTAFTVLAWAEHKRTAFVVHSHAKAEMDFTEVAHEIRRLQALYQPVATVIDGASRQGVEEMIRRHGLGLLMAEKQGKFDHQKLMNAEMVQGRIQVIAGCAQGLVKEWSELVWWADKLRLTPPRYVEHPRLNNHESDACLYAWQYTHTYLSKERVIAQGLEAERARHIEEALARQVRRDREQDDVEFPDTSRSPLGDYDLGGS